MPVAITRAVSPRISECELTFLARQPIDASRAAAQHEEYERRLAGFGCTLVHVADAPEMPDAVFVEDAAVVLDDVAIMARPGVPSRQQESASVADVLRRYRPLFRLTDPATLDGGDVLRIGRTLYVGRSQRTNEYAIGQLNDFDVVPVRFHDCLHLKSAVTCIDQGTLLLNPNWIDPKQFRGFDCLAIDPAEPFAANALRVGGALLYSASYPRTRRLLESRGFQVETVDLFELEKAEAGVTCCSLLLEASVSA